MIEWLKKHGSAREWAGDLIGALCLFGALYLGIIIGYALGG